jgi:hypothetical protein
LADLKACVGKLVTFFSGLTNLIDIYIKTQVEPFQKHLNAYARENQTKAALYGGFYCDVRTLSSAQPIYCTCRSNGPLTSHAPADLPVCAAN